MKKIIIALFFLFPLSLVAQIVIISGEKTRRPLTWNDFSGTPDHSTDLYAYTYWYVSYKWGPFQFKGDTVKWKVDVTLELTGRSWKKADKVNDRLLAHEQGHFDIGLLFASAFQKRVNETVFFRGNYEAYAAAIFNEELEKIRALELRYDKETEHYHNVEQQKKWEQFLKKELGKYHQ